MLKQRSSQELNTDDRQVYKDWLRKTGVAYMALVLGIIALVSIQAAISVTNAPVVVADSTTQASP
jgi:hypothetical protein